MSLKDQLIMQFKSSSLFMIFFFSFYSSCWEKCNALAIWRPGWQHLYLELLSAGSDFAVSGPPLYSSSLEFLSVGEGVPSFLYKDSFTLMALWWPLDVCSVIDSGDGVFTYPVRWDLSIKRNRTPSWSLMIFAIWSVSSPNFSSKPNMQMRILRF